MPDYITAAEAIAAVPKLAGNPELAQLITDASDLATSYTGRSFGLATQTEVHDGDNSPRVYLKQTPIMAVSAIVVNGTALDNTDGTGWTFNPYSGELIRGNGQSDERFGLWFPAGFQNVAVTYTSGAIALPGGLTRAVKIILKAMLDTMKGDTRLNSESLGDYSYTVGDPTSMVVPPMAAFLLNSLRLDWIA